MKIWHDLKKWQTFRESETQASIGFVPTMGALHQGHVALLNHARREEDLLVLSIFVNPLQFNDQKDYIHYPKTIPQDLDRAKSTGVDHVLMPSPSDFYPRSDDFLLTTKHPLSLEMEGAARPGHFNGVLTVVMKWLHLVKPRSIYLGEKDYQQWQLIQAMINDFFMSVAVVCVPTVREASGLPCSSRNKRLNDEQRQLLQKIYSIFVGPHNTKAVFMKNTLKSLGVVVDYVVFKYGFIFLAMRIGDVRIIDHFKPGYF